MTTTLFKQAEEKNRTALLKQQIINLCIQGGDTSISELSKALMVSVPTVTKFLGELIDEGSSTTSASRRTPAAASPTSTA